MSNETFLKNLIKYREPVPFDVFASEIVKTEEYQKLFAIISERTMNWAKSEGLVDVKKKEEVILSDQETMWKDFFKTHEFGSIEMQKNFADMLYILTGVNVSKFINLRRPDSMDKVSIFMSYTVIVPIDNDNGHNYAYGSPILCREDGEGFLNTRGGTGNVMSKSKFCFRLPIEREIEHIIQAVMYKSRSTSERLVYALL